MKPDKIRFMLYLRILLKYLQRKDGPDDTYERLKLALHECATRSRRQEKGFESLTIAMQRVIPEIVDQADLDKAREYLNLFVQQKRQMHRREDHALKTLDHNAGC